MTDRLAPGTQARETPRRPRRWIRPIAAAAAAAAFVAVAGGSPAYADVPMPVATALTPYALAAALVASSAGATPVAVASADAANGVDNGTAWYLSTWVFQLPSGATRTAYSYTTFPDAAPAALPPTLLVESAEPGTFDMHATSLTSAGALAAGPSLGGLLCANATGLVFKSLTATGPIGFLVGTSAGYLICSVGPPSPSTLKGLTWYNGLSNDAYGPYSGNYIDGIEDLVIRPYLCMATTGIAPCRGVTTAGTLGDITVTVTIHHVWPDGLVERTVHACASTACFLPYRYHTSYNLLPGTYHIHVTSEEDSAGYVYGPVPSGNAHRTYAVTG